MDKNRIEENRYIEQFESLWSKYPKKLGKEKALKTFAKDQKEYTSIQTALENYLKYLRVNGTEDQFIKHGSTWFNCWRDWLNYEAKEKENGHKPRRLVLDNTARTGKGDSVKREVEAGNE